jgi:hypothetical protein
MFCGSFPHAFNSPSNIQRSVLFGRQPDRFVMQKGRSDEGQQLSEQLIGQLCDSCYSVSQGHLLKAMAVAAANYCYEIS